MRIIVFILLLLCIRIDLQAQTYLREVHNRIDFNILSGLPLSDKYGQVSSVKVVYDLSTKSLYFVNNKYFKFHHDFCNDLTNTDIDLEYFNHANYSDLSIRRYLLGNINYYQSLDKYALEISPVDLMSVDLLFNLYDEVQSHFFIGQGMNILTNSARLLKNVDKIATHASIINPSEIYLNLSYQAISKHSNTGKLRFIKDLDAEKNDIQPKDIIVIDRTPNFLPEVSGIIVTDFQTPLSHLTILGQNRKIPICAFKQAITGSLLRKFENQKIRFSVSSDTFHIEFANNLNQKTNRRKLKIIKANLSINTLIEAKNLKSRSVKYVGNKAANFGILYKLSQGSNFKVPESGFAIPFSFYNRHIQKSQAIELLQHIRANSILRSNKDSLQWYLKQIRDNIERTAIDTNLLMAVKNKITSMGSYTRMRFRSSTNAEDAEGFSGAGLYASETGKLNSNEKSIELAIKKVWGSLWSYEAYSEREYYNIPQEEVYMGILVHRSFPDEGVNGVAITKNLYRSDSYGFVVNAQLGDEKVVKPKTGNTCDQFICYPNDVDDLYKNKNTVDIISLSNLNQGTMVMTDAEIQNLANQLERIKTYFVNHGFTNKNYLDFGLDVEFKLEGKNRDLYIKQVRVYND